MSETTDTRTIDTRTRRAGAGTGTGSRKSGRAAKSPQERAAEVEALAAQLNDAVAELTTSEAWLSMLRVAAKFTRYRSGRSGLFEVRECSDQLVVLGRRSAG
jgi:glutamine synthetase type III